MSVQLITSTHIGFLRDDSNVYLYQRKKTSLRDAQYNALGLRFKIFACMCMYTHTHINNVGNIPVWAVVKRFFGLAYKSCQCSIPYQHVNLFLWPSGSLNLSVCKFNRLWSSIPALDTRRNHNREIVCIAHRPVCFFKFLYPLRGFESEIIGPFK